MVKIMLFLYLLLMQVYLCKVLSCIVIPHADKRSEFTQCACSLCLMRGFLGHSANWDVLGV